MKLISAVVSLSLLIGSVGAQSKGNLFNSPFGSGSSSGLTSGTAINASSISATTIQNSALVSGSLVYAASGGLLQTSPKATFNPATGNISATSLDLNRGGEAIINTDVYILTVQGGVQQRATTTGTYFGGFVSPVVQLEVGGTGISASIISGTAINVRRGDVCNTARTGNIQYSTVSGTLQFCTGTKWQSLSPTTT